MSIAAVEQGINRYLHFIRMGVMSINASPGSKFIPPNHAQLKRLGLR